MCMTGVSWVMDGWYFAGAHAAGGHGVDDFLHKKAIFFDGVGVQLRRQF